MTDTTIRRIVWYVWCVLLVLVMTGIVDCLSPLLGHSQTTPCGVTIQRICACNGKVYDPHAKPVPGCVVKPTARPITQKDVDEANAQLAAPEPQAKPPENITPDWTATAHWHKLSWRDWSCYKVSEFTDGKGRQMFSCKLNRKITGKEK